MFSFQTINSPKLYKGRFQESLLRHGTFQHTPEWVWHPLSASNFVYIFPNISRHDEQFCNLATDKTVLLYLLKSRSCNFSQARILCLSVVSLNPQHKIKKIFRNSVSMTIYLMSRSEKSFLVPLLFARKTQLRLWRSTQFHSDTNFVSTKLQTIKLPV